MPPNINLNICDLYRIFAYGFWAMAEIALIDFLKLVATYERLGSALPVKSNIPLPVCYDENKLGIVVLCGFACKQRP